MQPDAGHSVVIELGEAGNATGVPAPRVVQIELPSRNETIPKVRAHLRRVAGDLFTPHTLSIGPYHQDDDACLCIQEKKMAVDDLIGCGVDITGLKQVLHGLQSRARGYYTHLPGDHAMDSEKFCSMLLHDGCYLLSLFVELMCEQPTGGSPNSNRRRTIISSDVELVRDTLYLLENQIPLFVIHEILNYLKADGEEASVVECIARPVETLLKQQLYISKTPWEVPSTSSHLLDLVYSYFAESHNHQQQQQQQQQHMRRLTGRWRRAIEYHRYADLLFKRRAFMANERWTILDVWLNGGSLSIPLLRVDSNTWTLLRNLMALEEHEEARPVTAYCFFMSQLARTAEDVELLRGAEVIEHFMDSDESVAECFAHLCDGVALDINRVERSYLKPLWHDLDKRCRMRAHNFKGFLREKYRNNVFCSFVFFIGFISLGCTVLQTIYAVLAYHKPNNLH